MGGFLEHSMCFFSFFFFFSVESSFLLENFFWGKLRSFRILISATEKVEDTGPNDSLLIPVRSESLEGNFIASQSRGCLLLAYLNLAFFLPPAIG